ncbi:MAG: phage tail tube protein [Vicinamibacterales bacterium]|nr:phage tail tube protein [Vicinamibacterales bacterium]
MAIEIGRRGKLYIKKELEYGETLTAHDSTDALRHINLAMTTDPFNRVTSPEKKSSPGAVTRFDRRVTAELGTLEALLRPSGTLNTAPECDQVLEAAFGSKSSVTLSTTVEASPSPSTTTATVASAGTLAAGDAILITRNGVRYVRILTAVDSAALTWAPALPSAPETGEAIKGCLTYKLTSALAISLAIAHYLDTFKRALVGVGINSLGLTFDANEEPKFTASGPGKEQFTGAGVPNLPAAFTTVGANPPSGLVGDLLINGTALPFKSLALTLTNGLVVRNSEYGQSKASELYRADRRSLEVTLDTFAETEATLYDLAEAGSYPSIFKQTGRTEGNIVALYLPKVDIKVPGTDDPDTEVSWSFTGTALETADGANDEVRLVLA